MEDLEKEKGIHINSAHNQIHLCEGDYTLTYNGHTISGKDAYIVIVGMEVEAEVTAQSRGMLSKLVSEMKVEYTPCFRDRSDESFIEKKMKYKKPRWQR